MNTHFNSKEEAMSALVAGGDHLGKIPNVVNAAKNNFCQSRPGVNFIGFSSKSITNLIHQ
jgi:hypothetical protein